MSVQTYNCNISNKNNQLKIINDLVKSTLKYKGKLVIISGEIQSNRDKMIQHAHDLLMLRSEIFTCFVKTKNFCSNYSMLESIIHKCKSHYVDLYKIININYEAEKFLKEKKDESLALDLIFKCIETIIERHAFIMIIDNIDILYSKSKYLLKELSLYIPYTRLTIIGNSQKVNFIDYFDDTQLELFKINVNLVNDKVHNIKCSSYLTTLLNKSGFCSEDINNIIKMVLKSNLYFMNDDVYKINGLLQYLNQSFPHSYFECISYYILLLLRNKDWNKALELTRKVNRNLIAIINTSENNRENKLKILQYFILGNYYTYVDKGLIAIKFLEKGLNLLDNEFCYEYYFSLGSAYMSVGYWDKAEKFFLEAYELSQKDEVFLPCLYINLALLYNFKCEFHRASFFYDLLLKANFRIENEFLKTMFDLLSIPISMAMGNLNDLEIKTKKIVYKLLYTDSSDNSPLYFFSSVRLYVIMGDHLFRCKDYKSAMEIYEKALILHKKNKREPYLNDFINVRIIACRCILGFKVDNFIDSINLEYKARSPFQKYMLCSAYFFTYFILLSINKKDEAKKILIKCIRFANSSSNLIYKSIGYYELSSLYISENYKKAKKYQQKSFEIAAAMGISPSNIPYTYNNPSSQSEDNRIDILMDYIKNNYSNDISLSNLSEQVYLSESHISHMIKNKTGYTFKELLLHTRVQEAKIMLVTSVLNISDIALSVGFSSSKYFCKVFKEICGSTPNTYRKKYCNQNIKSII